MNFLRLAPTLVTWAPFVYGAVILVEQIVGPGRTGEEKKVLVLSWLSRQAREFDLPWGEAAIAVLDDLIDAAVGLMNLLGYFRRGEDFDENERLWADVEANESEDALGQNLDKVFADDPVLAKYLGREVIE